MSTLLLGTVVGRGVRGGNSGMIGTHSREAASGGTFTFTPASAGAGSASTSLALSFSGDAVPAAFGSLLEDAGMRPRHFSRARNRFGVCAPRAVSGEKPSKASQAAANLDLSALSGRDA